MALAGFLLTLVTVGTFVISGISRRDGEHKTADFFLAISILDGAILVVLIAVEAMKAPPSI